MLDPEEAPALCVGAALPVPVGVGMETTMGPTEPDEDGTMGEYGSDRAVVGGPVWVGVGL